jgi:hypothetical protein
MRADVEIRVALSRRPCTPHGAPCCARCNRVEIAAMGKWFWDALLIRPNFTLGTDSDAATLAANEGHNG